MKNKSKYLLRLFLFLICAFSTSIIHSVENYKFRTLSPEGGFYFDGVKQIEQDKQGFIWIVMDNDLYRFDGYQYKRFHSYFSKIDHTKEWIFHSIAVDKKGRFFVTTNNGSFIYDYVSDSFNLIFDKAASVHVDNRNNIWLRYDRNWNMFDLEEHTLNTPLYDGDSIPFSGPICCNYNDDFYVFTNYERIYRFNYAKNEFVQCYTLPHKDGLILAAKAHQGKLWVLVNKYGLYKIDLSTFTIDDRFEFFKEYPTSVRSFFIDKKGHIWLGTLDGLYILNPNTREYTHFIHSDSDPFSLPNNSIWTINEDNQRNIWIGTYSGAVCYVNLDEKNAFTSYLPQTSGLNHRIVSAFAEDENYLIVGTEGAGLNYINKKTGEFKYLSINNGITFNNVKSMIVDESQNLWTSMYTGGLDYVSYTSNYITVKNFKQKSNDPNSLLLNNIRKIILENNSGIWIAYQQKRTRISFFSFKDQNFTHFDLDTEAKESYIFDLLRQGENTLWAISNEKLYRMDIKTGVATAINKSDVIFMHLNTFCLDDAGNIWIGTIGNGLIKYNTNTSEFTFLKDILQYNTHSIYSICYDNSYIWMGTDNGLYYYHIAQNKYMKFDKNDGTQGQVYYPLACMKGKDGKLYFGGTSGFTVVNPKEIFLNSYKPRVIISDFFIDHKSTKPNYSSESSMEKIILEYDQTNFGIQFSSDNYLIPEKNLFKYRLRGYDDQWIEVDASNRIARYSKVPAGIYYFEVIAANNDGIWSDTPTIIKIKRKAAPWFSWPAYMLYGFIILGIIYLIFRYYSDKKKLKMQLYLENLEKDKKEEIHQSQLRFFTNISHDFRTPLSLILAAVDKLKQEGLKDNYYRILNSNAQRLLNLINELMQFRTIENGKMKLEVIPLDVNHLVSTLTADFEDYSRQQNIHYQVQLDPELPALIYIDKSVFEKILMNLINNAFKYTGGNGKISIETYGKGRKFKSNYKSCFTVNSETVCDVYFSVVIRDTGIGISEKSIESVFERFYKVNTQNTEAHLGTGIGLALVKSLVLLHKGSITLYSEREAGTDIEVRLPLDQSIYDETEFWMDDTREDESPELNQEQEPMDDMQEIFRRNKRRILIVEDNADLLKLIADYFSVDYEIVTALDGVEASEKLAETEIDLIISDIMMPRKDGITFCQEVKSNMETSHIPVILLTAKTGTESKIEGAHAGADVYFEKPIDLSLLLLSVNNVFEHQRKLKEYYSKNFYVDNPELSANEQDNKFLKQLIDIIDKNIDQSSLDVSYIASELSMSRSKLYTKIKALTDKSIVEFILNYKMKKAARLIIEQNISMRQVMDQIGIESQAYFTNAFKKEFGETPTSFASKYRKKNVNK